MSSEISKSRLPAQQPKHFIDYMNRPQPQYLAPLQELDSQQWLSSVLTDLSMHMNRVFCAQWNRALTAAVGNLLQGRHMQTFQMYAPIAGKLTLYAQLLLLQNYLLPMLGTPLPGTLPILEACFASGLVPPQLGQIMAHSFPHSTDRSKTVVYQYTPSAANAPVSTLTYLRFFILFRVPGAVPAPGPYTFESVLALGFEWYQVSAQAGAIRMAQTCMFTTSPLNSVATNSPDYGNPRTLGFNGLRVSVYTARPSQTLEFHVSWFALGKVAFTSNQMVAAMLFQRTYSTIFDYAWGAPLGSIPVYELRSVDIKHFFKCVADCQLAGYKGLQFTSSEAGFTLWGGQSDSPAGGSKPPKGKGGPTEPKAASQPKAQPPKPKASEQVAAQIAAGRTPSTDALDSTIVALKSLATAIATTLAKLQPRAATMQLDAPSGVRRNFSSAGVQFEPP